MNRLKLTEENVIAIHEIGHLLSYLVGSIESGAGYRFNTDKLKGLSIIQEGEVKGRISVDDINKVEFREFVLVSGCMTVFFYYNQGNIFNISEISTFFNNTGGSDDIEELLKNEKIDFPGLVEKLKRLMENPKYFRLVDILSRDLLEKKELSKRGLQRLSFRLHNEIKTVVDEEKKRG